MTSGFKWGRRERKKDTLYNSDLKKEPPLQEKKKETLLLFWLCGVLLVAPPYINLQPPSNTYTHPHTHTHTVLFPSHSFPHSQMPCTLLVCDLYPTFPGIPLHIQSLSLSLHPSLSPSLSFSLTYTQTHRFDCVSVLSQCHVCSLSL